MSKKKSSNTIAQNRQASFEYSFIETFEAGIVLSGWEVKSLMAGKCNISGSYAYIKSDEVFVSGALIDPIDTISIEHCLPEPTRIRKLLLNRHEIEKLRKGLEQDGFTIVVKRVYWNDKHKAKVEIALAKGKKLHDKRQTVKKRENDRDLARLKKIR